MNDKYMKYRIPKARFFDRFGLAKRVSLVASLTLLCLASSTSFARNAMPSANRNPAKQGGESFGSYDDAAAPMLKEPRVLFGRPAMKTPAEQLAHAKALEKEGRIRKARKAYNALVHQWGYAPEAAHAQLGVAALYEQAGHFKEAFQEYQYYIDNFANGTENEAIRYQDLLASQFAIANALRSRLGSGWFSSPSADLVERMYGHIIDNGPDWERTPECMMLQAMCYEEDKAYLDAIPVYEALVSRYPYTRFKEEAQYRAATCRYMTSRMYPRDERTLKNALASLMKAFRDAPRHEMAPETSKRIAEMSANLTAMNFSKAEFYDKIRRDPDAAILAYSEFLNLYPTASEAPAAEARIQELKAEKMLTETSKAIGQEALKQEKQ